MTAYFSRSLALWECGSEHHGGLDILLLTYDSLFINSLIAQCSKNVFFFYFQFMGQP